MPRQHHRFIGWASDEEGDKRMTCARKDLVQRNEDKDHENHIEHRQIRLAKPLIPGRVALQIRGDPAQNFKVNLLNMTSLSQLIWVTRCVCC
jgi:hypothetical protein